MRLISENWLITLCFVIILRSVEHIIQFLTKQKLRHYSLQNLLRVLPSPGNWCWRPLRSAWSFSCKRGEVPSTPVSEIELPGQFPLIIVALLLLWTWGREHSSWRWFLEEKTFLNLLLHVVLNYLLAFFHELIFLFLFMKIEVSISTFLYSLRNNERYVS